MQVITGSMQAGEARGAQAAIAARQRGSSYLYYLLLAGFVVAGMAVAFALRFAVNSVTQHEVVDPGAAIGFGATIGAFGYTVFCRPYLVKRFRRNMTDRGLAVRFLKQ